jgi:hypothetical protein
MLLDFTIWQDKLRLYRQVVQCYVAGENKRLIDFPQLVHNFSTLFKAFYNKKLSIKDIGEVCQEDKQNLEMARGLFLDVFEKMMDEKE